MVQIGSWQKSIEIQLTPMRISESAPVAGLDLADAENITYATLDTSVGSNLVLHPGEPNEMIVQVKNLLQQSIRLSWSIEGDFPIEWCQLGTEGSELAPGAQMDAVLYFHVPASFFEDQEALRIGKKEKLELNYRSQVVIKIDPGTEYEQIEEADFGLCIRPYSAYMEFLPQLYHEVDFIGRFLKVFEQTYQPIIDSFNVMWANLDPLTAPKALLPFLAHWVGWPVEASWEMPQQRRLIRRAVELYRWRGTREGLRLYLHLYTGLPLDEDLLESEKRISIIEAFGLGLVLGAADLGERAVLGGGKPYHFSVRLRPIHPNSLDEELVRRIIDQEKPAFCTYDLSIENPPE
ncbi:MAG: phage tail protein [Nostoc desertorum CM1-VF14]|jgi:phage tail-like protein|nr:phage tail protein [Nostoc desertorum CM1-VF14]